MTLTPNHAFAPLVGTVRCAVCDSPRLVMIHAEPDGSYKKSLGAVIEDARAGVPPVGPVPPFPSEPAFGSPEAEKQAAETISRLSWTPRGMCPADGNHLAAMLYVREVDLMALEHSLHQEEFLHRETTKQRDALADALESALLDRDHFKGWTWEAIAHEIDAKPCMPEWQVKALAALRKAGRLP